MDKRSVGILLSCIVCTLIVLILFFITFRLMQSNCELIKLQDQLQYRQNLAQNWQKVRLLRAHDRSLLFRMSAYIEYHHLKEEESAEKKPINQQNVTLPALNGNQTTPPTIVQQNLTSPSPKLPIQSVLNFTNNSTNTSTGANLGAPKLEKHRILPIELNDVELSKTDDNRFTYTFKSNCTTIKMTFVRRLERINVEKVKVELKLANNKDKTSCELKLPNESCFGTEVHHQTGQAHYYCDKIQRYSCYDHNSKQNELLLDLNIIALEWELGNSLSNTKHSSYNFKSEVKTNCSVLPSGAIVAA